MKKLFLSLIVAIVTVSASAQVYVGGEAGLWRNWDENETQFTLAPEIGYELSDKWSIGTFIGYVHDYNDGVKVNGFLINPYARYTFAKTGIVSFFLDGGFDFATRKAKYDGHSSDALNSWGIGIKPGIKVSVAKNLDFIAHAGFLGYRDHDDDLKLGTYDKGFGFSLHSSDLQFGFVYKF